MMPLRWRLLPAWWRARYAYAAPLLVGVSILAGHTPVRAHAFAMHPGSSAAQGSVIGRYVLRSVNDQPLPVILAGDDPQHTLQVTDGLLQLNPDGSYLCRTVATDIHLGLQESFADTLIGGYTILSPNTIQLNHKGLKPDTITASGFQIAWAHPVRSFQGLFLYSK
jgi:hypothetical protein